MTEQISALIDDEHAIEDVQHIVARIHANRLAAEAWSQYHLIGDAMRGVSAFSPDFKQSLMQRLEQEPTVLAPNVAQAPSGSANRFKGRMPAKWSIAASFAAVMLVGWMALHTQTQSDSELASVEVAKVAPVEQEIPAEYLMAHQASAPSASSYYVQSVGYSESSR